MRARIETFLTSADPRLIWICVAAIAALIAFEGWHLFVRVPFTQYRQLHDTRVALASALTAAPREPAALALVSADVRTLSDKLREELKGAESDEQLTAFVMTELDRSATASRTLLKGVRPASKKTVSAFQEISYDVAAEGRYLTLCNWMLDLERALGQSAAVAEFTLRATEARQAIATVKVAFYRQRAQSDVPVQAAK